MVSMVSVRTARTDPFRRRSASLSGVALIQFVCALIFGVDIAYELHNDLLSDQGLTGSQLVHLVTETTAVGLLLVGFYLSRRELQGLNQVETQQRDSLAVLRGHFDDILMNRFEAWGLSKAESDVALFSLRGLKISEIALLRKTKEGTIKAQLSSIFHKAGIGTRTELLGIFMDEFLDFGANQSDPTARP